MKTSEEMKCRYDYLADKMKHSGEVKNMEIFGNAEKYVFHELASAHPEIAEKWLSHLEAVEWNQYLSKCEADNIAKRTINQDGTKGFHWDYPAFTNAVTALGGVIEHSPCYNSYALWVTANMTYSDHAKSVAEDMGFKTPSEVPNDKMALSMYKKALEFLNDKDDGFHIRKYFKRKMYDNSPMP